MKTLNNNLIHSSQIDKKKEILFMNSNENLGTLTYDLIQKTSIYQKILNLSENLQMPSHGKFTTYNFACQFK